jgi:hypothetical protein
MRINYEIKTYLFDGNYCLASVLAFGLMKSDNYFDHDFSSKAGYS